jgi:hypothetical protein
MAPSLLAPNTGNLLIGKGILSFKKTGAADYVDLGNCTDITLTPDMETLEHFSSRAGVRSKDLTVILEKKASVTFTMEEFTAHNIGMMLLGAVNEADVGGPSIDIFSEASVTCALKFVGTSEVGPKINVDLYNVSITPSGDFSLISDDWGNMEVTADVLLSEEVGPNLGKFGKVQITNIPEGS